MNILLDTHIVIWAIANHKFLSDDARAIILNSENRLYYSAASVIEVDWKTKSKSNNLDYTVEQFLQKCRESKYIAAPLKEEYIVAANHLIWDGDGPEHKDPFDRMLLAQAMTEGMKFMTHDEKMAKFQQDCVVLV